MTLDDRRARWIWTAKIALARRQAGVIATVSDYSRNLAAEFGIEASGCVIGEAGDRCSAASIPPTDRLLS